MDVLLPDAPAQQPVLTAGQELGDDELVESGADHADPRALRYQISLIDLHDKFPLIRFRFFSLDRRAPGPQYRTRWPIRRCLVRR